MERDFNEQMSLKAPHCAICQLFRAEVEVDYVLSVPDRGPVLVKERFWRKKGNMERHKDDVEESCLLVCDTCRVCVHAWCYG